MWSNFVRQILFASFYRLYTTKCCWILYPNANSLASKSLDIDFSLPLTLVQQDPIFIIFMYKNSPGPYTYHFVILFLIVVLGLLLFMPIYNPDHYHIQATPLRTASRDLNSTY